MEKAMQSEERELIKIKEIIDKVSNKYDKIWKKRNSMLGSSAATQNANTRLEGVTTSAAKLPRYKPLLQLQGNFCCQLQEQIREPLLPVTGRDLCGSPNFTASYMGLLPRNSDANHSRRLSSASAATDGDTTTKFCRRSR